MPSLARTTALILALTSPAWLAAQALSSEPENSRSQSGVVPPWFETGLDRPVDGANSQQTVNGQAEGSFSLPARSSPLPRRGTSNSTHQNRRTGAPPSWVTVVGSLAAVLGLFLVVAWVIRHATPAGSAALPGEVVEVLGRTVLANRQQLQLLRCGNKLLLVSVTPNGAETLTEITEPEEVDRLAGLCRQSHSDSTTAAFRQVFQQFSTHRGEDGNA